ncbi:Phenylacetaldehyde dehydrogenase [Daldinia childiae]|uniref:Phenylacetaldehyde dehydrogenase n=1 Tax=Daldinia childiae TaxID=326645 RepID=UPI001445B54F|nr:Phenylacetaldehyde dehydrogenase [Daldinia childiae]KAF3062484.1 Phenylacetaldehyde dehydrogenase [Daldinia childiae]
MNDTVSEPFSALYTSLRLCKDKKYIRVLDFGGSSQLHQSGSSDASQNHPYELRCQLRVVDLDENPRPKFIALSYVWGQVSSKEPRTIRCGRHSKIITDNCWEALSQLRDSPDPDRNIDGSITLWVDAICINQADEEEKLHQIRLMGDIYSQAASVCVWLGPGTLQSDKVMDYLEVAGFQNYIVGDDRALRQGISPLTYWQLAFKIFYNCNIQGFLHPRNKPGYHHPLDFDIFYNVIDGELSLTQSNVRYGINPITLEKNPSVPISSLYDVNRAVEAAGRAAKSWAEVPWDKRVSAIREYASAIEDQAEDFVRILMKETGKPINLARREISTCVQTLRGFCQLSLPSEVIEDSEGRKVVTRYTPVGVVVGIIPWNFPVQVSCMKMTPAILTGNAYIWKPSPYTPYCSLKFAELGQRFFPPGVLQALSGDGDLGPLLTEHPNIQMVSFTGSTLVEKKVMESCSKTVKRVVLELGGNDPAIVCANVDPTSVAIKIASVAFSHSGQLCVATKRIYVHEAVYDAVLAAMVEFVKTLKLGSGEDAYTGPISNIDHFEYVKDLLANVESSKLTVETGSTKPLSDMNGYYIIPTIMDNPPEDARVVIEEQFAPVLPLMKWSDEADVISRANNTNMGLGASVWSRDMDQAERLGKQLQAGNIWINTHAEIQTTTPFSSHKQSGLGISMAVDGLKACCNVQSIYTRLADSTT